MTEAEIETFLADRRHAVLATNSTGGPPQLSPVWYLYEGGRFYISVNARTAKYRNLERDAQVSLCVDGCYPDRRSIIVSGTATLIDATDGPGSEVRWRLLNRYYDEEADTHRHIKTTPEPEQMRLIVVTPQRVSGQDFNKGRR